MATKLKLKKSIKVIIVIVIILIVGIIAFIKIRQNWLYKQTYEYKLLNKGYELEDIRKLEKYYDEDDLYLIATKEKDEILLSLINNEKYNHNNLDRYKSYLNENKKSTPKDAIYMVNINRDFNFYEKTSLAKLEKGNQILVNKYFKLEANYTPDNLVTISNKYSWGTGKQIKEEAYNAFIEMWNSANKEDIYLMINLAYRSYEEQESLYNRYKSTYGVKEADTITARPGHSEHQTGLALDIFELHNSNYETFKNTDACKWLKENAYKYGFILRYTEDSQIITGFEAEDWHYRYVGKDAAAIIQSKNITLEDYYYNTY